MSNTLEATDPSLKPISRLRPARSQQFEGASGSTLKTCRRIFMGLQIKIPIAVAFPADETAGEARRNACVNTGKKNGPEMVEPNITSDRIRPAHLAILNRIAPAKLYFP